MSKLPQLSAIKEHLAELTPIARSMGCKALLEEMRAYTDQLIRLEHDAHLREIRRLGT